MYDYLQNLQPVILAGGESNAMGDKQALACFDAHTLIETVYTLLEYTFDKKPLIITNDRHLFDGIDLLKDAVIAEDSYPGHKALGGVATAFEYTDAENLFVIGVNMPFISAPLINKMGFHIQMADAVVPVQDDKDICLHAVYNRRLLPVMLKKIKEGADLLHSFFPEVDMVKVQVRKDQQEDLIFFDINTPKDLKEAEEQYEALKRVDSSVIDALKK